MIDNFLENIYSVEKDAKAIGLVFNFGMGVLDGLPVPKYEIIDAVLCRVDLDQLNITRMLGFAVIALWVKNHSKERPAFLKRLRSKIRETESRGETNSLLQGLEVK